MSTVTTNLVTIEEFEQLPLERVELVRGEVIEMPPPGARHSFVCANVTGLFFIWCRDHEEFLPLGNDCGFVTGHNPDSVRGVDAMIVRRDRLPDEGVPVGYITFPAELTVEVKSPSNGWPSIVAKALEYLACGVPEAWLVDPENQQVHVYTQDNSPVILTANDTLNSTALPGFSTPIAELFRGL